MKRKLEKKWVRVYLAKTLEEGRDVQVKLQKAGIEVSAYGHNLLRLPKWFGGPSDGRMRISVPEADEKRAREILRLGTP